jgi:halimadienyl-diphosphate synthase
MSVTTFTGMRQAAQELVNEMADDPCGLVTPSVYETARLVASASWLDGHPERVEFLLGQQHEDGTWGGPAAYGLLPTLSAIDSLLSIVGAGDTPDGAGVGNDRIGRAARSGLAAVGRQFSTGVQLPDTIAVELLVPWLVEQINQRLARADDQGSRGLTGMPGQLRLPVDMRPLSHVRERLRDHSGIPEKTWHSLEALGDPAVRSPTVMPVGGAVCASPAATVAWLGDPPHADGARACLDYLRQAQARHGGPVSGITSITYFEQAWVVTALRGSGLYPEFPAQITDSLRIALQGTGLAAGPGLPADSDDTAAALHALDLIGKQASPDCLWGYDTGLYFECFSGERTPSVSANAHVLVALADLREDADPRYGSAAERVGGWLIDRQHSCGYWTDKWHASPYYATACCVLALTRLVGPRASEAVTSAVRWVLDTQQADGSWGLWTGTGEETAYAMQVLDHAAARDQAAVDAIRRGRTFLAGHIADHSDDPPLWHDKDLYAPLRVIRAEILAAMSATGHLAVASDRALR